VANVHAFVDGGVSGLSALLTIDQMMQRLEYDTDSDDELRPCDWFDMIMGSGTGGHVSRSA
jgi:hypothetical protein